MNEKEPQPSDMDRAIARQVCMAWRNSLPDGSRMNKVQLFSGMGERIARELARERAATFKTAMTVVCAAADYYGVTAQAFKNRAVTELEAAAALRSRSELPQSSRAT